MSKIKSICLVSEGYPAKGDPFFPFVELLCKEFSRQGIQVTVICPQSILTCVRHKKKPHPWRRVDIVDGGVPIKIYQPYFLSLGYKSHNQRYQSYRHFKFVAEWTYRLIGIKPDICYAHFWYPGYAIHRCATRNRIPLFIATGEANLKQFETEFNRRPLRNYFKTIRGVIAVSSENKQESVRMNLVDADNCIVIPNAVDESIFQPQDKSTLRKEYGIKDSDFIVCFVGAFINRKGSDRVSAAIDSLNDPEIKSFFIGGAQGDFNLVPNCPGILKMGKIPHDDLPAYLSMADVFVLPTLYEGCCNAIVEALACGLPVISSDRSFNYDILDSSNSILVDPTDISAIASAIKELKDNPLKRSELAKGALNKGKELTITRRAQRILSFIESKL